MQVSSKKSLRRSALGVPPAPLPVIAADMAPGIWQDVFLLLDTFAILEKIKSGLLPITAVPAGGGATSCAGVMPGQDAVSGRRARPLARLVLSAPATSCSLARSNVLCLTGPGRGRAACLHALCPVVWIPCARDTPQAAFGNLVSSVAGLGW